MNIGKAEYSFELKAKTCGCNEDRTVAFSIVESFHGLCIGKKSILLEQIEACERSLDSTESMSDRIALLEKIAQLKRMLKLE
ncbi:MAG: hypothetical protein M3P28_00210 [Thermoproteota archaeon]|nr:hypothetical protein [Thermoproteota archaeon]